MNAIKVSDSVMSRFDGIMVQKDKEAVIRGIVLGAYS